MAANLSRNGPALQEAYVRVVTEKSPTDWWAPGRPGRVGGGAGPGQEGVPGAPRSPHSGAPRAAGPAAVLRRGSAPRPVSVSDCAAGGRSVAPPASPSQPRDFPAHRGSPRPSPTEREPGPGSSERRLQGGASERAPRTPPGNGRPAPRPGGLGLGLWFSGNVDSLQGFPFLCEPRGHQ